MLGVTGAGISIWLTTVVLFAPPAMCKKVGHLAKVCQSEERKSNKTHKVEESEGEEGIGSINIKEYNLRMPREPPVILHPRLNKTPVPMEVDTDAAVSILSKRACDCSWKEILKPVLKTSDVLRTYSDEIIKVMGKVDVDVEYNNQLRTLSLVVVEGDGPNLLGRNWLRHIKLNWEAV